MASFKPTYTGRSPDLPTLGIVKTCLHIALSKPTYTRCSPDIRNHVVVKTHGVVQTYVIVA